MKVIGKCFLRGPNLYPSWPCINMLIDLEDLYGVSSADLPGFSRRLCALMPSLRDRRCSLCEPDSFAQCVQKGTHMAHVVEHVLLELQCLAGSEVDYGQVRQIKDMPRAYRVVCAYQIESLIEPALDAALGLVAALAKGICPDMEMVLDPLRTIVTQSRLDLSRCSSLKAANTRDIPVIAITGTNGKTTTTLLIANVFRAAGRVTGVATTEGIYIDGQCVDHDDCTGYWSARTVLGSPKVEAAVLETARGGILKRGLGFDHCDVAVVLNVTADHLGQDGVETLEELALVKRVVAQAARRVVLNAEDPLCVAMALELRGDVEIVYFSCEENNEVLRSHLEQGGRGVYLFNGEIVLADKTGTRSFFRADSLAVTLYGQARHNVANTLAAVAALIAQGACTHEAIVKGIRSFSCSIETNPLRMNFFKVGGVTVLLDYAHNAAAYQAILNTARAIGFRRIVGVVSAPADRRDAQLQQIARVCVDQLDEMVVYEPDEFRGRVWGETAQVLFESGLAAAQGKIPVRLVMDVREAIGSAFLRCVDGDLLLFGGATRMQDLELGLAHASRTIPLVLADLKSA